jgi:hypothetical protein
MTNESAPSRPPSQRLSDAAFQRVNVTGVTPLGQDAASALYSFDLIAPRPRLSCNGSANDDPETQGEGVSSVTEVDTPTLQQLLSDGSFYASVALLSAAMAAVIGLVSLLVQHRRRNRRRSHLRYYGPRKTSSGSSSHEGQEGHETILQSRASK